MGSAARCGTIPALEGLPAGAGGARRLLRHRVRADDVGFPAGSSVGFEGVVAFRGNRSYAAKGRGRRFMTISASAESNKCRPKLVGMPLEPESPAGKFLCGILNDHPHIFPVAAAEQLEDLALERDGAVARRDRSSGSAESHLHERIAELKRGECQMAVEEVMYLLIFHRFSEIDVPMVPRLSGWFTAGTLDIWPPKDEELESIHHSEVLEMVRDHLSNVLGRTGTFDAAAGHPGTRIRRLQLGRIYAASIMYGYFLKSVCLRHHLEHHFALTSKDYPLGYLVRMPRTRYMGQESDRHFATLTCPRDVASYSPYPTGWARSRRVKKLRSYVMGFNSTALQICAKLKSREAVNLIEKHSRALFLGHDCEGANDEDGAGAVPIARSGMKHLVLEAVAFGTFLWDAERYIGSVYGLEEH